MIDSFGKEFDDYEKAVEYFKKISFSGNCGRICYLTKDLFMDFINRPCVYLLFNEENDLRTKGKIVYIGTTNHLALRIKQHMTVHNTGKEFTGIGWYFCKNSELALQIESYLIYTYNPLYNRRKKYSKNLIETSLFLGVNKNYLKKKYKKIMYDRG